MDSKSRKGEKMKNQIKLLIIVPVLFLIFCASSKKVAKQEDVEVKKQEKLEIEKQEEPRVEKDEDVNKLNDPSRSYEIIKEGIKKLYPELMKALARISFVYNQRDTVSLKFYISPKGSIDLIGFWDKLELDTNVETGFDFLLYRQIIDSTYKTDKFTKVIVPSYLDEKSEVALSEDIKADYVEIRLKDNILMMINLNKRELAKAYSKRWAQNPGLSGTVTTKFGIDEYGNVIYCKIINSTMNDPVFEQAIVDHVKTWKCGKINNPGDVTEIIYPFVFVQ